MERDIDWPLWHAMSPGVDSDGRETGNHGNGSPLAQPPPPQSSRQNLCHLWSERVREEREGGDMSPVALRSSPITAFMSCCICSGGMAMLEF